MAHSNIQIYNHFRAIVAVLFFMLHAQNLYLYAQVRAVEHTHESLSQTPLESPIKVANTYFAVKTNLLYDAVTALNVEIEVPVWDRFSILWEDVFPWWEIRNKYCFQLWEMGPEARFWFKKWEPVGTQKLRGWFVGIYGMSARYDFQWDRTINYQGEFWSAGISGGYVLPLGKKKRWLMEFSMAVGFLSTDYRHYLPTDQYDKLIRDPYQTGTVTYFGPTKVKVALSLPINIKRKKGGER